MEMKINKERILRDIKKISEFSDDSGAGVTRFSYGESDRRARAYIMKDAEKKGMHTEVDAVGNLLISVNSFKDKTKIIMGSHIDSVKNGGTLDGVYGVVSGLEALRTIKENNYELKNEVCLAIFSEEEGSNFGSTMTGSKFITGIYGEEDLKKMVTDSGETLEELLQKNHYCTKKINEVQWKFDKVKAMLELHIEQGPVLDSENLEIGIVQSIFGMKVIQISLSGVGNHAGASPMNGRKDALSCASEIITAIEKEAKNHERKQLVATVGKIYCWPNVSNVIPEFVKFIVEVRDTDNSIIEETIENIKVIAKKIALSRGIIPEISEIAQSESIQMTNSLINTIEEIARSCKLKYKIMDSGAVHDCAIIAKKVDAAMIFVPSIGGRSHVPQEKTKEAHLSVGAQLLLDTILEIDKKGL